MASAAFCFVLSGLLVPAPAHADLRSDIAKQSGSFAGDEGAGFGKAQDPRVVVANIIKVALSFLGTIGIVYTLYAGFLIMTAGGDETKVQKGKDTLKNGIIGVVIVLSAYSITRFAAKFATGDAPGNASGVNCKVDANSKDFYGKSKDPLGPQGSPTVYQNCID